MKLSEKRRQAIYDAVTAEIMNARIVLEGSGQSGAGGDQGRRGREAMTTDERLHEAIAGIEQVETLLRAGETAMALDELHALRMRVSEPVQ